jgi:hypothetical protein
VIEVVMSRVSGMSFADGVVSRLSVTLRAAAVAALSLVMIGCADTQRVAQLQRVAMDWCETIRASQVIPVYPLTADLRPGDVFMVQTPIARQAEQYRRRGFLALDDHRVRLGDKKLTVFREMYGDWFFKDPYAAGMPNEYPDLEGEALQADGGDAARSARTVVMAPRAAFPTYQFEVRSGVGAALALPIKGVPVGLNIMNTQSANGSVTIADARTYGGDPDTLYRMLRKWAEDEFNRDTLARTARQSGDPIFLRVVTRVYTTGTLIVDLQKSDTTGFGLAAGKAPPAEMFNEDGTVSERYAKMLDALNETPTQAATLMDAGGAVKIASASASRVTMAESFDTQLVIGYLGFDVPVYENGDLGGPIPTFERLERRVSDPSEFSRAVNDFTMRNLALRSLTSERGGEDGATQVAWVIRQVSRRIGGPLKQSRQMAEKALELSGEARVVAASDALLKFEGETGTYVSKDADGGAASRFHHLADVFDRVFARRDEATKPKK